ncbi:MAG: hypothetical protein ACO1SV_14095 [Fimbriimonas sp.]
MNGEDAYSAKNMDHVQALLGRHVVALHLSLDLDNVERQHIIRSGFVLEVEDHWFWVTAGHVIEEIEQFLNAGGEVVAAFLLDLQPRYVDPIPFAFLRAPRSHFYIDENVDIGWVYLADLYRRNLEANEVIAIRQRDIAPPTEQGDAYWMIGFPEEFNHLSAKDEVAQVQMTPTPLPLLRLDDETTKQGYLRLRFHVRPEFAISGERHLSSVVGMSGGPVLMLKKIDDSVRYWAIAVQSAWLRDARITFCFPLASLAASLLEAMRTVASEQ